MINRIVLLFVTAGDAAVADRLHSVVAWAIASGLAMTGEPLNLALEPSLRGTKQSPVKPYTLVVWAIASFLAMTGVVVRAIASFLAMTGVVPVIPPCYHLSVKGYLRNQF
jgi:hypothetical protein